MSRTTLAVAVALVVLVLASVPLAALEYEIRLVNGNVITTRYEPVVASFDPSRIFLMTTFGNTMSIPRDRVAEVISLTDAAGIGKRLDRSTIVIGIAPNDNPTPEEEAAAQAARPGFQVPPPYSIPLVTEPDQTQGLPLQFLNYTTPPLGGGSAGGSPADLRRGGGGGQFVEPQSRD